VVGTTPRACKLAVEIRRAEYFLHTTSLLRWYVFRLFAFIFLNLLLRLLCVCLSIFFGLFYAYALCIFGFVCKMRTLFVFFVGSYLSFVMRGLGGAGSFHHQQVWER